MKSMPPLSLRTAVRYAMLLAPLAFALNSSLALPPVPDGERLRDLGDDNDLWVGASLPTRDWTDPLNEPLVTVVDREYSLLTSENGMKMSQLEPSQGTYDFSDGQQLIDLANSTGAQVHGHTLVWYTGGGMPSWVANGTWTDVTLTNVLHDYIDNVVGHWAGDVAVWDVVNEAFASHSDLSYYDSLMPWTNSLRGYKHPGQDIWYDTIGSTYIEKAFIRARAADPNALLIINDYEISPGNYKSSAIYKMAQDFLSRSIPIDGIGCQMHMSANYSFPHTSLRSNFQRFSDLGLSVFITEFDCPSTILVANSSGGYSPVADSNPPTPYGLDRQAISYHRTLDMALRVPSFSGFQTWGVVNKTSGSAKLPFESSSLAALPAYYAIQDALTYQSRTELAQNNQMEDGAVSPWYNANGGSCSISLSTADYHSGTSSLLVTNRSKASAGPGQNITSALLDQGAGKYYVRAWMRTSSGSATGKIALRLTDGSGTQYLGISAPITSDWTEVSGWVNVLWHKELTSAVLYAETIGSAVDFYIDDVTISDGNIVKNASFDADASSWYSNIAGTLNHATTHTDLNVVYKYGYGGCLTTNRSKSYNGPMQTITTNLLASGPGAYKAKAFAKLHKPDSTTTRSGYAKMTVLLHDDGGNHYVSSSYVPLSSEAWSTIDTTLNLNWVGELDYAKVYIETPGSTDSFYIDEVILRK